jgi:hypothetical protein
MKSAPSFAQRTADNLRDFGSLCMRKYCKEQVADFMKCAIFLDFFRASMSREQRRGLIEGNDAHPV